MAPAEWRHPSPTSPMFDAFEKSDRDRSPRRTLAVTALSLGVYAGLGALLLHAGHEAIEAVEEPETEIHFAPSRPQSRRMISGFR